MNRNIVISLVLAAAAGTSFADGISPVDTTPFVSTVSRAQVQTELKDFQQSGVNPWSRHYNPLSQFSAQRTRADVSAEYVEARERVAAFTSEDSGSAYLAARDNDAPVATSIAGEPRNPQ